MLRLTHGHLLFLLVPLAIIAQWGCCRPDKEKTPRKEAPPPSVVLDPGHGGRDAGAWLKGGHPEKNLVLGIALQVERLLKGKRLRVILTRRSDEYIPLRRRAEIANDRRADLFVSIHANSCSSDSANGFEIYYAENGVENESLKAASFIQRYFKTATGARDRGIRKYRYLVLAQTKCPSVLVEVGYLSNRREAKLLRERSYRKKVAEGIAGGIIAYLKNQG